MKRKKRTKYEVSDRRAYRFREQMNDFRDRQESDPYFREEVREIRRKFYRALFLFATQGSVVSAK